MSTTTTDTSTGRSAHEDALWEALTTHPGTSTSELASLASVPKSTARKILAGWAADDLVIRTTDTDDGSRTGYRWTLADHPADTEKAASTDAEPPATGTAPEQADSEQQPAPADPDPAPPESAPTDTETDTAIDPNPASEPSVPEPQPETTDPAAVAAPQRDTAVTAGEPAAESAASPAPMDPAPAAAVDAAAEGVCPTCGRAQPKTTNLRAGALRGLVEDFLRDHPGEEFTPGQIAKELDRSSGAIYNALFVLTGKFVAEHTCDRPNKFKLHPSQIQP